MTPSAVGVLGSDPGVVGIDAHDRNLQRFTDKWGGPPNHETYTRPWDPTSAGGTNWATTKAAVGSGRARQG